jgi:phosphatidate cytidylyltransferase
MNIVSTGNLSAGEHLLLLFCGVGISLLVATVIGRVLLRYAGSGDHPVLDNLNSRINAWWAMAAMIGLAFVFGSTGVVILFAAVSFLALREFVTLTHTRPGDHFALEAAFYVALPVQYILIGIGWYGLYSIFIPVYGFLLLPILAGLGGDTGRFLERTAKVQWGLMICVFCISHVPALLTLTIAGFEGRQLLLIAFLILVVQSSDVLQYVWGKLAGRRQIAPTLSPSKTWEGFLGGVGSATLLGAALWWLTPFSVWQATTLALLINVMGFLGGLVMSAIKRDMGVKDWGRMVEGHGGVLDRMDSVCFSAPVFFHVVRYWWT